VRQGGQGRRADGVGIGKRNARTTLPSFPRKRESMGSFRMHTKWIPAFAGMTAGGWARGGWARRDGMMGKMGGRRERTARRWVLRLSDSDAKAHGPSDRNGHGSRLGRGRAASLAADAVARRSRRAAVGVGHCAVRRASPFVPAARPMSRAVLARRLQILTP